MNRYQFPEGFFWGAAASGPQTEGIAISRTVLSGTAGLSNNRSVFFSRLVRSTFVKPTVNIKKT